MKTSISIAADSNPTPVLIVAVLLAAIVPACEASVDEEENRVVPVEVTTIETGTIIRRFGYTGDIEGKSEIKVFAPIPDRIISLSAREGERVKRGEVLAVIRSKQLSQGVHQAAGGLDAVRAHRDGLKDQLERFRKLEKSGAVTSSQILSIESQVAGAQAQVRQLEATLGQAKQMKGDAIVRAPIDGVIGQVFVEVGDMSVPQIPVCTVVDMDRVKIKVRIPESDLPSVEPGQPVSFRVAARGQAIEHAAVSRVSPVLDRLSRTATMEIDLDNADHKLKPGMLARVELEVERHGNVVWAPKDALTVTPKRRGEEQIFRGIVVEGGVAHEREVIIGLEDGNRVEVLDGLKAGDQLVVKGQHLLADGDPVKLVAVEKPTGPATDAGPA